MKKPVGSGNLNRVYKNMRTVKEELQNILDCMTGADGGVGFVALRVALDQFEKEAADGNEASAEVLKIVARFSKIIDLVQQRYHPEHPDPITCQCCEPPVRFEFEPEEDDGSDEVLGEERQR